MKFKKQHTPSLHEKMKKRKGIRKKDTRYTVFSRQYEVKEKSKKEKKRESFRVCFVFTHTNQSKWPFKLRRKNECYETIISKRSWPSNLESIYLYLHLYIMLPSVLPNKYRLTLLTYAVFITRNLIIEFNVYTILTSL